VPYRPTFLRARRGREVNGVKARHVVFLTMPCIPARSSRRRRRRRGAWKVMSTTGRRSWLRVVCFGARRGGGPRGSVDYCVTILGCSTGDSWSMHGRNCPNESFEDGERRRGEKVVRQARSLTIHERRGAGRGKDVEEAVTWRKLRIACSVVLQK